MWRRLSLLVLSCMSVMAIAPSSALAHHANITATVDCTGLVSYTATSWASDDSGVNQSAAVSINGTTVATGGFSAANGHRLSGTYQLAAPFAPATATVTWGRFGATGNLGSAGSASTGTGAVPPCPPTPALPGGSVADVVCSTGGVLASLTNTGGTAATIRLTHGATTEDVVVGPNDTVTRLVPVAEDSTVTITISSGGAVLVSRDVTANCVLAPAVPAAAVATVDCASGGSVVTLGNTGEASVTFTVTVDGTTYATVPVARGSGTTVLVPVAENGSAAITVTAPGMVDVTSTVGRDCIPPAVPAAAIGSVSCVEGGAFVTLTNAGGEFSTFTITVNGVSFDTLTIGGGATGTRLVPVGEDGSAQITVAAPLLTTVTGTVARDCLPAAAPTPPDGTSIPPAVPVGSEAQTDVAPVVEAEAAPEAADEEPDEADGLLVAATGDGSGDALPLTGASMGNVALTALLAILLGSLLPFAARSVERRAVRRRS